MVGRTWAGGGQIAVSRWRLSRLVAVMAVALAAAAYVPAAASASGSGLLLTVVARYCAHYDEVMANRARNNIMESLRDLGANTVYTEGEPINPVIEEENQAGCKPMPSWKFTLGEGIEAHAASGIGPWGSLSIITGQLGEPIETETETPLLDAEGDPTGEMIKGATTVELGERETELAGHADELWIQAGTPADPILNKTYPEQYGFASMRCAVDNLNGDNVEWVGYPPGTRHVFCFAYYVQPPPTAGEITIKKKTVGTTGSRETFHFDSNVSFNPGGAFELTVYPPATEAEQTFIRAETRPGDAPWKVREKVPADWNLKNITCTSESGKSVTETELSAATASITLAPEDHVTCVYEDEFIPPVGHLTIRKTSLGGIGTFKYVVKTVGQPNERVYKAEATTLEEGLTVDAIPTLHPLTPGDYHIVERERTKDRGTWKTTAVGCDDGKTYAPSRRVPIKIESGVDLSCTFTNELKPTASLRILKQTENGIGSFGFAILSRDRPVDTVSQEAEVTSEGQPFDATGEPSDALFFEPYILQEIAPAPTANGHWELISVNCDGEDLPFASGAAVVDITEERHEPVCLFSDRFVREKEPPEPPEETARISVTKHADQPEIKLGQKARYTIDVKGLGPAKAREVVVDDQFQRDATLVSIKASQGSCSHKLPLHCLLGSIAKGAHATIRVVLIPHRVGYYRNRAIVGLANPDPGFAGDSAHARVLVRAKRKPIPPHKPSFTG